MNGMQTRQGEARADAGDDVDQTSTELEPMCSPRQENSVKSEDGTRLAADSDNERAAAKAGDNDDDDEKWTTFGDILERFAGDTSLLGVPRAILASSRLARLFWVVVCVTCIMFIDGTTEQMIRYFSYPKQVTVEMISEAVPFPAVTLCNFRSLHFDVINRINERFTSGGDYFVPSDPFMIGYMMFASKLTNIIDSEKYESDHQVRLAIQEAKTRFALYANSKDELLQDAGIQIDQYVASCSMGGMPCDITSDFNISYHPYYLNCYKYIKSGSTASSAEDTDGEQGNSEEDIPFLLPGLDNGLSMVVLTGSGMVDKNKGMMDVLPGLHDAGAATAGSDGVRVMIHPTNVVPFPLAEGFDVPPGFSASLSVRPRRNERIGPPHGNCIHQDPFLPPSERQSQVYRQMACQQRCLQRHIRDVCRCYDESLPVPRVPERDILGCHELNFPPECSATPNDTGRCVDALMTWYEQIRCAKRVREQVQASRAEMARCQCRAACDERYYEVSYSLARWPAPGFESDAVYHSIFDVNRFMEQFNDSATFRRHFNASGDRSKAMEDFARINVYVADPEVLVTKESPEYDETALVSDIGGQLGLWIGASLITAAEILEFVWNVVNKFFDLRACRRRRKPRRPSSANDVGI